jgi:hypothetical protein
VVGWEGRGFAAVRYRSLSTSKDRALLLRLSAFAIRSRLSSEMFFSPCSAAP